MAGERGTTRTPDEQVGIGAGPGRRFAIDATPELRDLMTRFPTGVGIVTSANADGVPCGLTCNSLTSVCLTPPTLLVCVLSTSRTLAAAIERGAFALNLLCAGSRHLAERFALTGADKFLGVSWRPSPSGLPWLVDDTVAMADCAVTGAFEMGDHTVLLGRLDALSLRDASPLLYGHRRYAEMPHPVMTPPSRTGEDG